MTTAVQEMSNDEIVRAVQGQEPRGFGGLRCDRGLLPMEAMDVRASITGLSASIHLAQTFRNSLNQPLEVTYIFPLPPRAAVSSFKLEVAGRVIDGLIKERGQARREYQQAINTGHRAAITEEDRSGVFTIRAGNIMPGESAVVHLELVGPLAIEDGDPCFRFPLVVAPRYMPGSALDGASVGDGTAIDTDQVPDASRISPPVMLKGCKSPVRLKLEVDIDSGDLPLSNLRSSLHSVITEERAGRTCIKLQPGESLDRDFILRFGLGADDVGTQLSICPDKSKREDGNTGTIALTLVPPKASAPSRPRDIIFVLDRSGSMSGWKMVAARRAVGRMLDTLTDADRYNVYAFDNRVETPSNASGEALIEATDRNRYRTLEWLSSVDSKGGTEMLYPITKAFEELAGGYQERDRMMVLITDGQVGNEDHILRSVKAKMRNVRVFTIGIDRAVNEGFLRRLAVLGGGSCALVESEDRLDDVMAHIHRRIATPVITELSLVGEGIEIDTNSIVPRRLPDLFEGSPTIIRARYRGTPEGKVTLSGSDAVGMSYTQSIVPRATKEASVHSIWARGRVRDLEDQYAIGDGNLSALEKDILGISLSFGVLSRFTSFVAVDKTEVVNPGGGGAALVQPVEAPSGWAEAKLSMAPPGRTRGMATGAMAPIPMAVGSAAELFGGDEGMDERDFALDEKAAMVPEPAALARPAAPAAPMPQMATPRAPTGMARTQSSGSAPPVSAFSGSGSVGAKPARRGLFSKKSRKKEASPRQELTMESAEVDSLLAYQQRLRELIERATKATDLRAQLRILVQGLSLILDDLKSVHATNGFVSQLTESLSTLRVLLGDDEVAESLANQVKELEKACQSPSSEPQPPAPTAPTRRGFWK